MSESAIDRVPCPCPDHPTHLLASVNGEDVLLPYHEVVAAWKASGAKMRTGKVVIGGTEIDRVLRERAEEAVPRLRCGDSDGDSDDRAADVIEALLARLSELTPPLGSTAAFYLLSAGDPEC